MSFIWPRAGLKNLLIEYKNDELDKMKVLPSITGYTQAYYRNTISVRENKLKDAWYANNISYTNDCKILIKKVLTVILRMGICIQVNNTIMITTYLMFVKEGFII